MKTTAKIKRMCSKALSDRHWKHVMSEKYCPRQGQKFCEMEAPSGSGLLLQRKAKHATNCHPLVLQSKMSEEHSCSQNLQKNLSSTKLV